MELSEEEKKAIELLKKLQKKTPYIIWGDGTLYNKSNQIQTILNLVDKLTEKVKQLEKGNRSLMESRIKWKNRYYKEKAKNKEYINKIREKIKNIEDIYKKEMKPYQTEYGLNVSLLSKKEKEELINKRNGLLTQKITLEELLEEK